MMGAKSQADSRRMEIPFCQKQYSLGFKVWGLGNLWEAAQRCIRTFDPRTTKLGFTAQAHIAIQARKNLKGRTLKSTYPMTLLL